MPNTKPLAGARLAYGDLTKDLTSCYLFNENGTQLFDYARGKYSGSLNTGTWDAGNVTVIDPTDYVNLGRASEVFGCDTLDPITDLTIVVKYRPTSIGSRGVSFGPRVGDDDTTSILHARIPDQNNRLLWAVGGSDSTHYLNPLVTETITDNVFAFVLSQNRGLEIWQDGVLIAFDRTKTLSWTPILNSFALGDASTSDANPDFNGLPAEYSFFYAYRRALAVDEIIQLSASPYSLFASRTYFIPSEIPTKGGVLGGGSARALVLTGAKGSGVATIRVNYRTTTASAYTVSGVVVGGQADAEREYTNVGSGGAIGGSSATPILALVSTGGCLVGSSAEVGIITSAVGDGGVICRGTSAQILYVTSPAIGGSVGDGVADIRGGIAQSGLQFYDLLTSGGVDLMSASYQPLNPEINGQSLDGPIYMEQDEFGNWIPSEGMVSTLDVDDDNWNPAWANLFIDGGGGATGGGSARITSFQAMPLSNFGILAGGRAVVTRIGPSHNVRTGTGRALAGENKIKTAETLKSKVRPTPFSYEIVPPVPVSYRYPNQPTWCDQGEKCTNGAYLPKIVKKWQGIYLPPKSRGAGS
jgi:hypothetical protein